MSFHISPHARTLRKAREQVKCMVADDVSLPKIKQYLSNWAYWWAKTSGTWSYDKLMTLFIKSCWDKTTALIGKEVLTDYLMKLRNNLGSATLVESGVFAAG